MNTENLNRGENPPHVSSGEWSPGPRQPSLGKALLGILDLATGGLLQHVRMPLGPQSLHQEGHGPALGLPEKSHQGEKGKPSESFEEPGAPSTKGGREGFEG